MIDQIVQINAGGFTGTLTLGNVNLPPDLIPTYREDAKKQVELALNNLLYWMQRNAESEPEEDIQD